MMKAAQVWDKRMAEQFIKEDIIELETLAFKNNGVTVGRLERRFSLTLGKATKLKSLAVLANNNWGEFHDKYSHVIYKIIPLIGPPSNHNGTNNSNDALGDAFTTEGKKRKRGDE